MPMINDIVMMARYASGLRRFFRNRMTLPAWNEIIASQLKNREQSFIRLLKLGVYDQPDSPYKQLLSHAGFEYDEVVKLIRKQGIEATLSILYDAGVRVSLDEFKGRTPIERPGISIPPNPRQFDNPLTARHYEAQSSGSRGAGTRIVLDLDLLQYESAYAALFLDAFALHHRPIGGWMAVLPGAAGMKLVLRYLQAGHTVDRWFTPFPWITWSTIKSSYLKYVIFAGYTALASRMMGKAFPLPIHVPLQQPETAVRWLARCRENGHPALFETMTSMGVRLCLEAERLGEDISGTFFRVGGEPLTPTKRQIFVNAGCRVAAHYAMAEIGRIGMACAAATEIDDVHLMTDKIAVIQRDQQLNADSSTTVGALIFTTILPHCPKILLNVESGDYGIMKQKNCACELGKLGLRHHLHQIRSYEKLTSEGVTFLGVDLLRLVEEVLPHSHGGHPTDYQLVEEEEGGLNKVSILVHPRIGDIDEEQVRRKVIEFLNNQWAPYRQMTSLWSDGQVLRVVRREPYATRSAKILPLHIIKSR